jgi:hypothetical protein
VVLQEEGHRGTRSYGSVSDFVWVKPERGLSSKHGAGGAQ